MGPSTAAGRAAEQVVTQAALRTAEQTAKGPARQKILLEPLSALPGRVDPARTVIVTDQEVRRLYGSLFPPCPVLEAPRGEAAKSLPNLEALFAGFLELGLDRGGCVLGIGGGSVTDLAGFAAATWMRGVDFVAAPTTLLAMVDASIGGKNGVDFRGLKNVVGTFHMPRSVSCDVATLSTLGGAEFRSGLAEAIKHSVLDGPEHFEFIESIRPGAGLPDRATLEGLVGRSQRVKTAIVAEDERESGVRRLLNLGHTLGHAVEAATGLPHGHCVAAGLGAACSLAVRRGAMLPGTAGRIASLLAKWDLPPTMEAAAALTPRLGTGTFADEASFRGAVAAAIRADKKRLGEGVHFVLPEDIGKVSVVRIALAELESFAMEAP